jgi:hypothetical protein
MSDTGFNFEIKVDGVDKALTGTSKVAEHLEMLQQVLPGVGEIARRSFAQFKHGIDRVTPLVLTLRRDVSGLIGRVDRLGSAASETGKKFVTFGVNATSHQIRVSQAISQTTKAMRSLRTEFAEFERRSSVRVQVDKNGNQATGQGGNQTATPVPGTVVARDIMSVGESSQKAYAQYVKASDRAVTSTSQLRVELGKLKSRIVSVGESVADVSRDFQAMAIHGKDSTSQLSKSLGNTEDATKGLRGQIQGVASDIKDITKAKTVDLKINRKIKDAADSGMSTKALAIRVSEARVDRILTRNVILNGNLNINDPASKKPDRDRSARNSNDPASMIRQYVGVALASVASYNVVRSGFSGTVEEARFNNEWQSMTRELAAVFKPLMEAATDATRYVRQQLEKLDSNQQDLLMYGALGTVGAIGLHKMGMLGAVAGTAGGGLMTAGRGLAGVGGAAARGLGGAKMATGLGALLSVGTVGYEKYQEFKGLRMAQRIMTNPMSKLNPDEQMAMLKTGQDVEGMSDDDKREVRRRYADATRRRREQRMADEGKNTDGTEMGFMGRMTNRVGNFFGSLGIGGSERREDEKTRRDIRVLDMAAKHRFAMTGKGDRNPFGDLNNLTKEEMDKAGRGPEPRRLMLAQSGFGEAGGLRDDLQTQALILAAVAQNDKILGKDKNQQENMTPEEKLIRVLEKLDKRLAGENEKPDERPAPPVMIGAR